MKKLLVFVLISALLIGIGSLGTTVYATDTYDFANFTEADSVAFVEQCGITIPDGFADVEQFPAFTRALVLQAYNNPDAEFCFNFYDTQRYAEDIRTAVKTYMDLGAVPVVASESYTTLQYNTVMDDNYNWVARPASGLGMFTGRWGKYNCYAFAINRPDTTPFYSTENTYMPGDMGNTGSFSVGSGTAWTLANVVYADLVAMGYSNISLSPTIPEIDSSQELICVRIGEFDYHFMRYDLETDAWYHKPGNSAVLKFNTTPSSDIPWQAEAYCGQSTDGTQQYIRPVYYPVGTTENIVVYDSEIVFITYSKNQINATDTTSASAYIQSGKDVYYALNFAEPGKYEISLGASSAVEYNIYENQYVNNVYFNTIKSGYGTEETSIITVTAGYKYYLRVNFESSSIEGVVDITVEPHQHRYTHEPCNSATHHLSVCDCGYEAQTRHVVEQTSAKFAPCLQCGQMVIVSNANIGTMGDCNLPEVA